MKKLVWIFCFVLGGLTLQFCDSGRIYEHNEEISGYRWNMSHVLRFEVEITDTIGAHNLYLNVRNTGAYAYSNLWVFVKEISPDGKVKKEKFNCTLATPKGEWYGSGFGNIFDLQIPFKQNVIFPKSGVYSFELIQGMRIKELEEIVSVGIRIEKANQ